MSTFSTPTLVLMMTVAALILNLPFGYLRGGTKKLSFKWFLYIHLPIPAIYFLRTAAGLGYRYIPFILAGAVLGQLIGSRLYNIKPSHNGA